MDEKTKKEVDEIFKKAKKKSNDKNLPSKETSPKETEPSKETKHQPEVKKEDKLDLILKNQEVFSKDMRELKVSHQDLKKRQDDTENFLNSMVIKPAGQNPNDENQVHKNNKGNEIDEKNLENLSDEEKQKLLEKQAREQEKQQEKEPAKEQGKGQTKGKQAEGDQNPLLNPQVVYLLTETMKNLSPVVQAALTREKGKTDTGDFWENIGLGKKFVGDMFKQVLQKQLGILPGGDNRLSQTQQMQQLQSIMKMSLDGFFNMVKSSPKAMGEELIARKIEEAPVSGYQFQVPGSNPPEERIIP